MGDGSFIADILSEDGWTLGQPDLIVKSLEKAIAAKTVTYDFERLMPGAKKVKTSEFASEMIKHMG